MIRVVLFDLVCSKKQCRNCNHAYITVRVLGHWAAWPTHCLTNRLQNPRQTPGTPPSLLPSFPHACARIIIIAPLLHHRRHRQHHRCLIHSQSIPFRRTVNILNYPYLYPAAPPSKLPITSVQAVFPTPQIPFNRHTGHNSPRFHKPAVFQLFPSNGPD
jgi:hypothetical protein